MNAPKTLILYQYFEDAVAQQNLSTFLHSGYTPEVDFVIILAGGCSIDLPSASNLRYIFCSNQNYDFGGYAEALSRIDVSDYEYFVFINSSSVGPLGESQAGAPWFKAFTDRLVGDIGICGATINVLSEPSSQLNWVNGCKAVGAPAPHIQTYAYAVRRDALDYLIKSGFYLEPVQRWSKDQAIAFYEIELSRRLLSAGWNLSCLAHRYDGLDYRVLTADPNQSSFNGSPIVSGGYFGENLNPLEVLFVKPKRDYVTPTRLEELKKKSVEAALRREESAFQIASDSLILKIKSAWRGHRNLARDLVEHMHPRVIVDLGVDYGFSTLSFACYARDNGIACSVFGIDSFEGDQHAGDRDTEEEVLTSAKVLGLTNLKLIRGYFSEVAQAWEKEIDILHIDGLHTYEAVREDYFTWSRFVSDEGIILMHDTCVPGFGVRQLFDEIMLPKINFKIWNGLGVVSRDQALIARISRLHSNMIESSIV